MPAKTVIVAILATVLLFGTVISGCQRKRDNRDSSYSASAEPRRGRRARQSKQYDVASARSVRPAEVLSASAYRPPLRRQPSASRPNGGQPYNYNSQQNYNNRGFSPVQAGFTPIQQAPVYQQQRQPAAQTYTPSYQMARSQPQSYEPLPEPVPVSQLASNTGYYTSTPAPSYATPVYSDTPASSYSAGQPGSPVNNTANNNRYEQLPEYAYKPSKRKQPIYTPMIPPSRPQSPDLAMAQARLPNPVQTAQPQPMIPLETVDTRYEFGGNREYNQVPTITPGQFDAPIPELEPVHYQRVANARQIQTPRVVPIVPVLMSTDQEQTYTQANQFRFAETSPRTAGDRSEIERALSPLNSSESAAATGDWVPSPATAMYW